MLEVTISPLEFKEFKKDPIESLKDYVRIHKEHLQKKEFLEEELKSVKESLEQLEMSIIPHLLNKMGVTSVPFKDGTKVDWYQKVFTSIRASNKEEAFDWLKENGFGGIIKNTPSVHPQTLNSLARELIVERALYLPENLFNQHIVEGAKIKHGSGE